MVKIAELKYGQLNLKHVSLWEGKGPSTAIAQNYFFTAFAGLWFNISMHL